VRSRHSFAHERRHQRVEPAIPDGAAALGAQSLARGRPCEPHAAVRVARAAGFRPPAVSALRRSPLGRGRREARRADAIPPAPGASRLHGRKAGPRCWWSRTRSVTREHLVAILTAAGYDVVAAADGADALLMMSRRPFDLILADIVMPLLDGFKLLEVVRDKRIESPGGLKLDLLTRRVVGAPNCPYRAVNTGLGSRHGSSLPSGRTRSVCWIALRIERQRTVGFGHGMPTPHSSTQDSSGWISQTQPSTHCPHVSGAMIRSSAAPPAAPSRSARGSARTHRPSVPSDRLSPPGRGSPPATRRSTDSFVMNVRRPILTTSRAPARIRR
jgi:Response regulator receiver domain